MKTKLFVLLSLLVIASMIFSACAPVLVASEVSYDIYDGVQFQQYCDKAFAENPQNTYESKEKFCEMLFKQDGGTVIEMPLSQYLEQNRDSVFVQSGGALAVLNGTPAGWAISLSAITASGILIAMPKDQAIEFNLTQVTIEPVENVKVFVHGVAGLYGQTMAVAVPVANTEGGSNLTISGITLSCIPNTDPSWKFANTVRIFLGSSPDQFFFFHTDNPCLPPGDDDVEKRKTFVQSVIDALKGDRDIGRMIGSERSGADYVIGILEKGIK